MNPFVEIIMNQNKDLLNDNIGKLNLNFKINLYVLAFINPECKLSILDTLKTEIYNTINKVFEDEVSYLDIGTPLNLEPINIINSEIILPEEERRQILEKSVEGLAALGDI